ncbi:MAG: pentapeptide repeat-containing protein [Coxiellaceae bacterium]|nr:pentapeptide repeat-containing protein [Coxiellaceae bacterium]
MIKDQHSYEDKAFDKLDAVESEFNAVSFERCKFHGCDFSGGKFNKCKFIDCEFVSCNLSVIEVAGSNFSEVVFEKSKCVGINWTQAYWPQIHLTSPLAFYHCNLNHSSFFGLQLNELVCENSQAHEVDFREADLSNAVFGYTDFAGCQFVKTNLTRADFTGAQNYQMDISLNKLTKAKFSFPEVVCLLDLLDIEIDGLSEPD